MVGALVTFNLCSFAWIFFRARSVGDAAYIASHLHVGWGPLGSMLAPFNVSPELFVVFAAIVSILALVELASEDGRLALRFADTPIVVQWSCYGLALSALLFAFVVALGNDYQPRQFIYFQF